MGSTYLTAIAVEKLLPPVTGRVEVYDAEVPGLTLRISATGVKSWSFTYRKQERPRRLSLGCFPGVSLKLARERAREARGEIQRGGDPVEDHRAAELDARMNVFKSCVGDFIEKYAKPNQRTWEATESVFNRLVVPAWGTRSVREIRRRDVADLLDEVAKKTPCQAHLLRAHLSRLFNWLIEREVVEVNPVRGIRPQGKPEARSRVLKDAELAALWRAAGRLGGAFGAATKFLMVSRLALTDRAWLGESDREIGVIGVGEIGRIGVAGLVRPN